MGAPKNKTAQWLSKPGDMQRCLQILNLSVSQLSRRCGIPEATLRRRVASPLAVRAEHTILQSLREIYSERLEFIAAQDRLWLAENLNLCQATNINDEIKVAAHRILRLISAAS